MALTDWKQVKSLGKGGQGEVFLVEQPFAGPDHVDRLRKAVKNVAREYSMSEQTPNAKVLIDILREIVPVRRGALKRLHPPEAQINTPTALERMKREIATLQSIDHPALSKVLEENLAERWFVMEFCHGGALKQGSSPYKGQGAPVPSKAAPSGRSRIASSRPGARASGHQA